MQKHCSITATNGGKTELIEDGKRRSTANSAKLLPLYYGITVTILLRHFRDSAIKNLTPHSI